MTVPGPAGGRGGGGAPPRQLPGFNEYLLGGIVGLMLVAVVLGIVLYLLPAPHLQLAELQPSFRVARTSELPVGSSRIVNWGDRVVLVVRFAENSYAALQGTAPSDGCILQWDPASLHVHSPCTSLVYDLHGNRVRGLSTVPLQRYSVFIREGVIYVTGS